MTFFRDFSLPLWEMFAGNLLLLACSLCYLAWWAVSFRPGSPGGTPGTIYIAAAFITGCAGILLMSGGINTLSDDSKGVPVRYVLVGGVALFIVMLLVTSIAFHRIVTSELMIIHVWAVLELSAVAVLYGTGRFGPGRMMAMAVLLGTATLAGLICYVLYYRLDEITRYHVGMVPLAADAFVMALFLSLLAIP